jgi:hypothetical protein
MVMLPANVRNQNGAEVNVSTQWRAELRRCGRGMAGVIATGGH